MNCARIVARLKKCAKSVLLIVVATTAPLWHSGSGAAAQKTRRASREHVVSNSADGSARESNSNLSFAEIERIVKGAAANKFNDELIPAGIEHVVKDIP